MKSEKIDEFGDVSLIARDNPEGGVYGYTGQRLEGAIR
jgi:hypothetical protein